MPGATTCSSTCDYRNDQAGQAGSPERPRSRLARARWAQSPSPASREWITCVIQRLPHNPDPSLETSDHRRRHRLPRRSLHRRDHPQRRSVAVAYREPDDRAPRSSPPRRATDLHRHRRAPLPSLPSNNFAINQAWLTCTMTAHDLLVWCQRLLLTGDLARTEPKRLRYTLLHTTGIIARTSRRTRLRLATG